MPASQLSQLKAALTTAGLDRRSPSKKDKRAFKKGGARETDRAKTLQRLEDIRRGLNKFDERETKLKHDVGGRILKGVKGRPSASKQAGLEQRKKSLLPEHQLRRHAGTFKDRRFGESDPSLSLEDRMLERYTRERQRGQGKKGLFNLEDEDEGLDGFEEGTALGGLTHGGRSVVYLPGDDFETQGLGEDDEEDKGGIHRRLVSRCHIGGLYGDQQDEEREDQPERTKSKAEVMSEIIAKSKEHKYERQQQKEVDTDLRDELDEGLDDIRALLHDTEGAGPSRLPVRQPEETDADYDQVVRTLAFEGRAKPKNRTKTEEELAIEEKERLEEAEAKRLRRMRGELSDDEGEAGARKRRRTDGRKPDADDLDDDFLDDQEDLLGPGLTREALESLKLPVQENDEDGSGNDDEDEGEEGSDQEDDPSDEGEEDGIPPAMDDLDEETAPELEVEDDEAEGPIAPSSTTKIRPVPNASKKEIPYTFPCPSSIEEFEDILEGLEDSALPTVVQRIRSLHHPSLAQGNKEKLQGFLGVLLDYILIVAGRAIPAFNLISVLTPHIIASVKLNPLTAATHFIAKLSLMQKNLARGHARGASREDSKTFPGCPEIVILRLVGVVWSTSDFSHPVVAPAVLLMCQYLGQSRIRSVSDLASGLFLCSLLAQYETHSKRLFPEAVNFIASAILALLPRRKGIDASSAYPDLLALDSKLSISSSAPLQPQEPVDLPAMLSAQLSVDDEIEQRKPDLLALALVLVDTFAALYSSSEAFIEIFAPLETVLKGSRIAKLCQALKDRHTSTSSALARMLTRARASRRPLAMQAHKPIPIASFAPKFEDDFAPGRHYDPDTERNSSAKVRALYKKERQGAIRELRKDNRFLAGEKAMEHQVKDSAYTSRMRRVEGEINMERAEEKAMQREKAREKRRAGRK